MPKVYAILVSRDLKKHKVGPSTTNHPNIHHPPTKKGYQKCDSSRGLFFLLLRKTPKFEMFFSEKVAEMLADFLQRLNFNFESFFLEVTEILPVFFKISN